MIFDFFSVKAIAYLDTVLVVKSNGCGNCKGDTLICRSEKGLDVDVVLLDALSIELAELCKLCPVL